MIENRVPIASLKARLSEYIAESRRTRRKLVITSRNKMVAILTPVDESGAEVVAEGGVASLAGDWKDMEDIASWIGDAVRSRSTDNYREISL